MFTLSGGIIVTSLLGVVGSVLAHLIDGAGG